MRPQLRILFIQTPVEHDRGAAIFFAVDAGGHPIPGQELAVDVTQVRVGYDDIRLQALTSGQKHAGGAVALHQDLLNGSVVEEFYSRLFGDVCQCFCHSVHATHGVIQPVGELGVLHERIGGRRFIWAEPHVHILKSEGDQQARILEKTFYIVSMAGERLQPQENHDHARIDKLRQAVEILTDHIGQGEPVIFLPFLQVAQHPPKLPGSMASRRVCISWMSEVNWSWVSSWK